MNRDLTLRCVARDTDKLRVVASLGNKNNHLTFWTEDEADAKQGAIVTLDADKARELFNWLGVWLLTQ